MITMVTCLVFFDKQLLFSSVSCVHLKSPLTHLLSTFINKGPVSRLRSRGSRALTLTWLHVSQKLCTVSEAKQKKPQVRHARFLHPEWMGGREGGAVYSQWGTLLTWQVTSGWPEPA